MRAIIAGTASVATLLSIPTIASAVSPPTSVAPAVTLAPRASSICSNVSAAAISSIVGYKVPAGTASVFKVKATKANFGISGVDTVCTYGEETSMAALLKDVSLTYEVLSKPITLAEIEQETKADSKGSVKYTFVPYTGLGVPAFYFSLTEAGITGQGIFWRREWVALLRGERGVQNDFEIVARGSRQARRKAVSREPT